MSNEMEDKLQRLGNFAMLKQRLTRDELAKVEAKVDAAIARTEALIKARRDRRQDQQPYAGDDKRHGDRRRAPRDAED